MHQSKLDNYEAWVLNQFLHCYPDNHLTFNEIIENIGNDNESEMKELDGEDNGCTYARWDLFEDWNASEFANMLQEMVISLRVNFTSK